MTGRGERLAAAKVKIDEAPRAIHQDLIDGLRLGVISIGILLIAALFFSRIVHPLFALGSVEETVMDVLTRLILLALPFVAYIAAASVARRYTVVEPAKALALALTCSVVLFALISAGHYVTDYGVFAPRPSLEMTLSQTEAGIRVDALVPGGAADTAEMQVGDVITAIRRDPMDLQSFNRRVGQAEEDDPLRLRFIRGDEEMQETVRVVLIADKELSSLLPGLAMGLIFTAIIVFLPGHWAPYIALVGLLSPLIVGYAWVIIATFSFRTEGLIPLDGNDNIGGFTLKNWESIFAGNISGLEFNIWPILMTTLAIAVVMTVVVLLVSSMAGYALVADELSRPAILPLVHADSAWLPGYHAADPDFHRAAAAGQYPDHRRLDRLQYGWGHRAGDGRVPTPARGLVDEGLLRQYPVGYGALGAD